MELTTQEFDHLLARITSPLHAERKQALRDLDAARAQLDTARRDADDAEARCSEWEQVARQQEQRADALQAEKDAASATVARFAPAGSVVLTEEELTNVIKRVFAPDGQAATSANEIAANAVRQYHERNTVDDEDAQPAPIVYVNYRYLRSPKAWQVELSTQRRVPPTGHTQPWHTSEYTLGSESMLITLEQGGEYEVED